ncbi:THO complex subunit 2 [Zootermopsis nevadensis]|uniref:THO complex subunit 2 n=2 Tax=Zootermopsis nevadensis TaxID=136037 RepID=A0A067R8H4_ZOONE|nr:THO complex subunit 2 [Zootermopsis nevadensis]
MAVSCLSSDMWKSWERQGKTEFIKACKQFVKSDENVSPVLTKNGKNAGLTRAVYELIWHGIKGPLRREATATTLGEIVNLHSDMPSIILDVVSVIDAETSCAENNGDERQRFCFIVKETEKFLSDKLLKERLEIDTLQDVGTLKNRNFYTKFIKVKTKLYYKQRKFNLFREESEGYAKLITELNQEVSGNVTPTNILEVIKSLIGCFNLDPNRVLDIILESFECRRDHHHFFIPLLRSYMCDPKILCEVLGFKYCFYQNNAEETTPKSLYFVTALMLQHNIIALDDIYSWLTPDDKVIHKEWEKDMKEAKEYVRKLGIICLKDKDKEEPVEEKENVQEKYAANQKFGLCEALLKVGDWNHAKQLTKRLPEHCVLDQPPVARALCELLHSVMEPVYRKNCGLAEKIVGRPVPLLDSPLAPQPARSFVELRESVIPMLLALGPSMHYDPVLMYKVIRLAKAALTQGCGENQQAIPEGENNLYYDIITLLDEVILPSLSYMDCNCCIAEEVWNVIKLYPYQCRYCLYSRWKNETYQQHAKLLRKRGEALKKIKSIMKRVSKENIKPVGRLIGKLTHCSPGFLFDYVLVQIQIYDNLINPVVDSLKYLTSLSYDVLGYCLIESLASADRDRFKHDGTSISLWLQSLASFCGAIFKKYNIELTGLLQYVANQLKAQKSLDLLILKEIVQKMAGIEAAEEMTPEQLEAMAGGELLKGEAGYFSQVRNTKKSSQRLKEALSEQNLAVALCLLMAQQRYCVVYKETDKSHLKLVGKLYDQCQDTLVQFGTFLGSTLSMEEYVTKLPTIHSMLADYHIHADVAFFLARPMFTHAINLKYDALRKADPNCKKLSPSAKHQKYCEAAGEVMSPIVASVRPLHPPKVWEDISPQFLVTFWSLTMYDLFVPNDCYQREINKIKQLSLQVMDSKDMAASKGKKEQERYTALMEKLQEEKKKQHEHVEKVMARLKQEKDSWFLSRSAKSAKNETITQFLQLCLFPRCIFTATDAVYCAKFVHTIHSLKTANFSTLLCYDRLFCDITYSVTSCTENEANRYGRFLCAMLETVMRWHSEKATFEKECSNYPGFVTKFRVSNQFSEANDHVGYENYRHVCHKWHYKITKAMVVCLDSKDYVQIRNSLIILIKILPHFPVLAKLSQIIERKIEKVREEEKNQRQDLFILATSYSGQLKAKSASMIRETDFHQVGDKPSKSQDCGSVKQELNNPAATVATKQVNGEIKQEKDRSVEKTKDAGAVRESNKERSERKSAGRQQQQQTTITGEMSGGKLSSASKSGIINATSTSEGKREALSGSIKEKSEKEKNKEKDYELKEKLSKKEERREEGEREKRSKEKKEDKAAQREERALQREERAYRDDRYLEMPNPSLKEEQVLQQRFGGGGSGERYYGGSSSGGIERSSHYYPREPTHDDRDRDLSSLSNSSSGSGHRRSQEPPEVDRDVKRRKLEGGSSTKSSKHEERKQQQLLEAMSLGGGSMEKPEKKERSSKTKDKSMRDKNVTEEEKELRKERKLGRKRDRAEEAMLLAEQKRRKEEEKAAKLASHQNGEPSESHGRDKHHYPKDKSPYSRERERSHDREGRDKHRRSNEGKRR